MASTRESQRLIAHALLGKPLTMEEIADAAGFTEAKATEDVREMLKLGLLEKKEGYPTRYALGKTITEALSRRTQKAEKDPFGIRLRVVIEVKAVTTELLDKQLSHIADSLQKDKHAYTVYELERAPVEQDGEYYSSYLNVQLSVRDFRSMVRLLFYYGPSAVEVIKPEKLALSADDLQDGLVEISGFVQAYAEKIARQMSRQELDAFYQKLFHK